MASLDENRYCSVDGMIAVPLNIMHVGSFYMTKSRPLCTYGLIKWELLLGRLKLYAVGCSHLVGYISSKRILLKCSMLF